MDDRNIRRDILDELEYDPSLDAAQIGVAVEKGIATLSGQGSGRWDRCVQLVLRPKCALAKRDTREHQQAHSTLPAWYHRSGVVSQRDLLHLTRHIDNQPCKSLGYRTPTEVFMANLQEDR
jgi:hypothetical protein